MLVYAGFLQAYIGLNRFMMVYTGLQLFQLDNLHPYTNGDNAL